MQDVVDNRVIKRRSQILRDLDIELGYEFREQFVGEIDTILTENSDGQPCGRSERYFMVYLEKTGVSCKKNELVRVKLVENRGNGVIAQAKPKRISIAIISHQMRKSVRKTFENV